MLEILSDWALVHFTGPIVIVGQGCVTLVNMLVRKQTMLAHPQQMRGKVVVTQ